MPGDLSQTHCPVAGCPSWSMRGSPYCRVRRAVELGSCGGGAHRGSLDAIKTGGHAHPLAASEVDRPDLLSERLERIKRSIYALAGTRTDRPTPPNYIPASKQPSEPGLQHRTTSQNTSCTSKNNAQRRELFQINRRNPEIASQPLSARPNRAGPLVPWTSSRHLSTARYL